MRRLLLICAVFLAAVLVLSQWRPGASFALPTATAAVPSIPTPLPEGFTLIPTFVPSYPCELQNLDVYDDTLCRSERVTETVLAEGEQVAFIGHEYRMGAGCWGSVSQQMYELRACDRASGQITILAPNLVTGVVPAPAGDWLAFGTMNPLSTEGDALKPHVFRVRTDGSGLQQLDTVPFPDFAVGAPRDLRWLDNHWLAFALWDGSGEDGLHSYRLKADGTGHYEPMAEPD
jgi:hypothetical protein